MTVVHLTIGDMYTLFGHRLGKSLYNACYEKLPRLTRMSKRRYAVLDIIKMVQEHKGTYFQGTRTSLWKQYDSAIVEMLRRVESGQIEIGKKIAI